MPKPWDKEKNGLVRESLPHFFLGQENQTHIDEIIACFDLMQYAYSLGSIMKFELSDSTRLLVKQTVEYWHNQDFIAEAIRTQLPAFELILALTEKYHALVMNPPYMYSSNMPKILSTYINLNYDEGRTDLCVSFMRVSQNLLRLNGKYGMINMQSWMFLTSFSKLRTEVLTETHIDSLLHLGPHTFDELNGEVVQNVAFIITLNTTNGRSKCYRLVNGNSSYEKEKLFLTKKKDFFLISQRDLIDIPGTPLAYWITSTILKSFIKISILLLHLIYIVP